MNFSRAVTPRFPPSAKMPFGTGPPWSILRPHHPQYPLPAPPGSPWGNILTPQAPPSTRTPTSGPLWTSFRAKKHEISRNHPTSPHGTHGTILDNQVLRAFGAPYGTNEETEYWVLLHLASHAFLAVEAQAGAARQKTNETNIPMRAEHPARPPGRGIGPDGLGGEQVPVRLSTSSLPAAFTTGATGGQ